MFLISGLTIIVLIALGLLHFYWAMGGQLGITKAVPEIDGKPTINPGPITTAFVGVALLSFSALAYLLAFYDLASISYGGYAVYFGWLLAAVFTLRAIGDFKLVGFFKKITSSEFAKYDTKYYSPLCLSLGIIFSVLSYGQP